MTAAINKPATSQRNTHRSAAARCPTAIINHTHMSEAISPAVNARSITCGTHSSDAAAKSEESGQLATPAVREPTPRQLQSLASLAR